MSVVCDSSVIIYLSAINALHLLEDLFGEVLISPGVYEEVARYGESRAGADEAQNADYLRVVQLEHTERVAAYTDRVSQVDAGLIVLAHEQTTKSLLTQDRGLRRCTRREGIEVISFFDILIVAKRRGPLQAVRPSLNALRRHGVLIREGVYQETLRRASETEETED